MTDIEKIAETLGVARMIYENLGMMNTAGLTQIERTKQTVRYERARRDVQICERDLRTAIEGESYERK
jgi:hypothetical protein